MMRVLGWTAAVMCVLAMSACGTTPLPTYPAMSDAEALAVIAERLDAVKRVTATADIVLTDARGESVSLDGAFVAEMPDRARLRAWKFGTAVLDLTITPDGVWAIVPEREGGGEVSQLSAMGVARSLEMATGAFFRTAHAIEGASTADVLVVQGRAMGVDAVQCEIDRATLTPRRYTIVAETGDSPQEMMLTLDRYDMVKDQDAVSLMSELRGPAVAWARRVTFSGPKGEIVLRFGDVELNGDVEPSSFAAPRRAVRLP